MISDIEKPEVEAPKGPNREDGAVNEPAKPTNDPGPESERPAQVPPSPYWLIVSGRGRGAHRVEVFTVARADGEKTLPVFGSEAAAGVFMRTLAEDGEWWVRKTGGGELLSVLSASEYSTGPCAGVVTVAIDPPLELVDGSEAELGLVSTSRKCFMERLMGRGRAWFDGAQGR